MKIVNDEYWLLWAKNSTDGAIEKLDKGADNLKIIVLWLWSIYTAIYTAGGMFAFSFGSLDIPVFVIILLGIPVITLILTYCLCFWAQLPIQANIHVVIPDSIKLGYAKIVKEKYKRLKVAIVAIFISAGFLSAGLFSWFITKNNQNEKILRNPIVESCLSYNNDTLFIAGVFPENTLTLTTIEISNSIKKFPVYVKAKRTDDTGILQYKYPLDSLKNKTDSIFVSIIWENNAKMDTINALLPLR